MVSVTAIRFMLAHLLEDRRIDCIFGEALELGAISLRQARTVSRATRYLSTAYEIISFETLSASSKDTTVPLHGAGVIQPI